MQHSPAINAGAQAIPGLEDGADLEPPHGTPPPLEVAETPDSQSPKQTRAPTNVRESLKSLRGQRIVAHNGPDEPDISTRTRRRDTHLPDLPNLHTQGSAFLVLESVKPMANVSATQGLEKSGGASALDDSFVLLGSLEDLDRLGLTCSRENRHGVG